MSEEDGVASKPPKLSRKSWGPLFWTLLHTLAECVGYEKDAITERDEAEAWILLLQAQPFVMPCQVCRTHLKEYLRIHRIEKLRDTRGASRYGWIQSYIFELHEHVNRLTQNMSSFTKDMLPDAYPHRKLTANLSAIQDMFQTAFDTQQLKPEDVHRWKMALARLRGLYGV